MRRSFTPGAPTSTSRGRPRAALETILAAGSITISRVGLDKYRGRVDALVATRDTTDVSAALLNGGWARSYDGGRRGTWC
jgi:endonuclease YncB( thermonuclease family)